MSRILTEQIQINLKLEHFNSSFSEFRFLPLIRSVVSVFQQNEISSKIHCNKLYLMSFSHGSYGKGILFYGDLGQGNRVKKAKKEGEPGKG